MLSGLYKGLNDKKLCTDYKGIALFTALVHTTAGIDYSVLCLYTNFQENHLDPFKRNPSPRLLDSCSEAPNPRRPKPKPSPRRPKTLLLKGSWDLVTRVINKVTILIITYNPN